MKRPNLSIWLCSCALGLLAESPSQAPSTETIAAQVNDAPVYVSQVDWLFHKKFFGRDLDEQVAQELRALILKQLVEQEMVVQFLKNSDQGATDDEVDLEVQRIAERLKAVHKSLRQFLEEDHQTELGLRFNLRFQMGWKKYLDEHLTDTNLEKYFDRYRRQFDGTQINAAHLLIPLDKNADAAQVERARSQCADIRQALVAGNASWKQAVQQYSSAPTRDRDGDIGWISYSGPMPRPFTLAAFALQPGEISPPVQTSFGVHLIKCLQVREGQAKWYDVRPQLEDAATKFLFDRIVSDQQDKVEVRYSGNAAYLDPATGQFVDPDRN